MHETTNLAEETSVELEVRCPDDGTSLSLRTGRGDDGRPFVWLRAQEGTYRPSMVDLTPGQLRAAAAEMVAMADALEVLSPEARATLDLLEEAAGMGAGELADAAGVDLAQATRADGRRMSGTLAERLAAARA